MWWSGVVLLSTMYQSIPYAVLTSETIPPPAWTGSEDLTDTEAYEAGRKLVRKYEHEARMPKYSQCWTTALSGL